MKEILFSVTAKDCNWDYYVGSGKGGQKRNKTANCVRCTHIASNAVGKSEDGRSQKQNKQKAFKKMFDSKEFKAWHRIETSRQTGQLEDINKKVAEEMTHIRVEGKINGTWAEMKDEGDL